MTSSSVEPKVKSNSQGYDTAEVVEKQDKSMISSVYFLILVTDIFLDNHEVDDK